jgi:hypothetical protein
MEFVFFPSKDWPTQAEILTVCGASKKAEFYITPVKKKVKLSLQQAVEDYSVVRCRASHIF